MKRFHAFLVFVLVVFFVPQAVLAESPAGQRGSQTTSGDEDIHFVFGQMVAMPPVLQAVADECAKVSMHQEYFDLFSKHLLAEGTRRVDLVGEIHRNLMEFLHGAREAAEFDRLIGQVKVDSYKKLQDQISGYNDNQKEAACGKWKEILLAREQFNISNFIAKYMKVLKKTNGSFYDARKEKFVMMGLLPQGIQ